MPKDSKISLRAITPHTILSEKLSLLQSHLEKTTSDSITRELLKECQDLIAPLDSYLAQHSSKPSSDLDRLEFNTNKIDWDSAFAKAETSIPLEREMLSGAVEGQLLQFLAAISRAKNVLEIGSFTSYASLAIAEVLPEDGKLVACEYDSFTARFAQEELSKSEHGHKVEIKVGDALKTLKSLADDQSKFDLVFIDANKTGYLDYYNYLLDHQMLNAHGFICVDNTLLQGQAYGAGTVNDNGRAIQEFNEVVAQDKRVHKVMLPLRDGVTLIRTIA